MGDDATDRDNGLTVHSVPGSGVESTFALNAKLVIALTAVVILSFGLIACSLLFIYMCFLYPNSAVTILPIVIPAAIGGLALHFGKKAQALISQKNDKDSSK